jgi:mannose-1-phosphate guanylyltransferase
VKCEDINWSDLGSFDFLDEEIENTKDNNSIIKSENIDEPVFINSKNNLLVADSRQISMIDINDLLVIDTADALLISKNGSSQDVKKVLEQVKLHNSELAEKHTLVYRPWGSYQTLVNTSDYKVKKIILNPRSKLSLQKHFLRSEHWVVLAGIANVSLDNKEFQLYPNESSFIGVGQKHRLENQQNTHLVIIEVQVGKNISEDDIVRFD